VKTGKSRKDKFYHLAKETGFRSRAAFKLLQLNRKYEFLQQSRVCVDLCAAPGGWLQVASQNMPVSSVIVGVDLVPIRPIPRCKAIQGDITTEKCRQDLKKELQTWDADVVLHDGAPNVGKSWTHDAYQQAELTLHSLKLATEFLRKGGWFVTKVFRSKDYHSLMWVFNQLFKKVFATKPQASRNESAEIFVVCQHFTKPDKIDPKFLDPKHVFKDVATESKPSLNLIHPTKDRKKADGYDDDKGTLRQSIKASEFVEADNFMELLGDTHEVVLDSDWIKNHELTTAEIKACCEDVKVLGKKEIKLLLAWRKKMRTKKREADNVATGEADMDVGEEAETGDGGGSGEDGSGDDSEDDVDEQIANLKEEEMRDQKRKKKKVLKEKKKLRDKMNLKMVIKGDKLETGEDQEMFSLKKIAGKKHLAELAESGPLEDSEPSDEDSDDCLNRKKTMTYERNPCDEVFSDSEGEEMEMEEVTARDDDEAEDDDDEEENADDLTKDNPLIADLDTKDAKASERMERWFSKGVFADVEDESSDLKRLTAQYKKQQSEADKNEKDVADNDVAVDSGNESDQEDDDDDDEDSDTDDSESDGSVSDYDAEVALKTVPNKKVAKQQPTKPALSKAEKKDGFEIVPAPKRKLSAEGLAIGAELIHSAKRRREIIEASFNRYTFNDEGLPDWFVKDESRHCQIQLPVTKEQITEYKERQKAIDAKPIKKIAEARARKKRKSTKKLEKARKKADEVSEQVDVTDKEKMAQMKQIYKKAGLLGQKKEDVTYVVAKKGTGRKVSRPQGIKGKFKVVDPRMKKDLRKQKINDKKNKGKGGKKSGTGAQAKAPKQGAPAGRRKPHRK